MFYMNVHSIIHEIQTLISLHRFINLFDLLPLIFNTDHIGNKQLEFLSTIFHQRLRFFYDKLLDEKQILEWQLKKHHTSQHKCFDQIHSYYRKLQQWHFSIQDQPGPISNRYLTFFASSVKLHMYIRFSFSRKSLLFG